MGPPAHETPDTDWDFLFDVNLRTLLNAVRAVVPHMLASGGGNDAICLAAAILAEGGLPAVPGLASLPWRGTPALTRHPVHPAAERLLLTASTP